jgi:hypothetical protein
MDRVREEEEGVHLFCRPPLLPIGYAGRSPGQIQGNGFSYG